MRSSHPTLCTDYQPFTKQPNARPHSYIAVAQNNDRHRQHILAPLLQRQPGILRDSQKRFSDEVEHELESDGYHPSDDSEFARGALIAAAIGLAMWSVVFLIVKLVF